MAFENLFVRTKRTIGSIQLDSVIRESHENTIEATKNPIESGVDITDHAIILPKRLSIYGVVTDSPLASAALGQIVDDVTGLFGSSTDTNLTRSQQAYAAMILLMENREPIEITTRLKTYSNMLIKSIKTDQDKDTSRAVFLNIECEEVILTESETLDLTEADLDPSVAKSLTQTVEKGRQETITPTAGEDASILSTLVGWLGG